MALVIALRHLFVVHGIAGVLHVYIHVEYDNVAARRVYEREGYLLEKQETAAAARLFCRKPRLLLHKVLVGRKPPSRPFSCQA